MSRTPESRTPKRPSEHSTACPWHPYDRGIGWEVHSGHADPNEDGECASDCGGAINQGFRETFTESDARLIAAAPDLLNALKTLDRRGGLGLDVHAWLRDVIAKAEPQNAVKKDRS